MNTFIQQQNEIHENEKLTPSNRVKTAYFTYKVKSLVFLFLFVVLVPTLVFYLSLDLGNYKSLDKFTCSVLQDFRVPCGHNGISQEDCEDFNCCFDVKNNKCYHFIPSKYFYQYNDSSDDTSPSHWRTPYNTTSEGNMQITINEKNEDQVSIILHQRDTVAEAQTVSGTRNYRVEKSQDKLLVEIFRKKPKELLLSTARGPLIASDRFWEWTLYLGDGYLFGLDRTLIQFDAVQPDEVANITRILYPNKNDFHPIPILWAYKNGRFHGVAIKHPGPIEVIILAGNLIILRGLSLGEVELELSLGITPRDLRKQQAELGSVPPRWALDPYVCRKGNTMSVRLMVNDFEMDPSATSYCVDQDLILMAMNDPKNKHIPKLQELLTKLSKEGKRLILSMPPYVVAGSDLYNKALDLGVLYRVDDEVYTGSYSGIEVAYPDYSHSNIQEYIKELDAYLEQIINVEIAGFVFNDNWPTDESFKMSKTDFPYLSKSLMHVMSRTLPWYATNNVSEQHVKLHSSYGRAQIESFADYYNNSMFIMSASGSFRSQEPAVVENVNASWDSLRSSMDNLLFRSIAGNHLTSVPVCGDTDNYDPEAQEVLCMRWYWIAATAPLFRVSSVDPWREPNNLFTKYGEKFANKAITLHRNLEVYFYTLLSQGEPVLRPMFFDYYYDNATFGMRHQYMLGRDILVAHPLTTNRRKLPVYLPKEEGAWYEFWGGQIYRSDKNPWVQMDVREADFLAFIIQGRVIVLQDGKTLNLVVALHSETGEAEGTSLLGENYWKFNASSTSIAISNIDTDNCAGYVLGLVKVFAPDQDASYTDHQNVSLCTGNNEIVITNA